MTTTQEKNPYTTLYKAIEDIDAQAAREVSDVQIKAKERISQFAGELGVSAVTARVVHSIVSDVELQTRFPEHRRKELAITPLESCSISEFTPAVAAAAEVTGELLVAKFNGIYLGAEPGVTAEQLDDVYHSFRSSELDANNRLTSLFAPTS